MSRANHSSRNSLKVSNPKIIYLVAKKPFADTHVSSLSWLTRKD